LDYIQIIYYCELSADSANSVQGYILGMKAYDKGCIQLKTPLLVTYF